jgi:RNA polymerase sigma factor (sigma-70 family)
MAYYTCHRQLCYRHQAVFQHYFGVSRVSDLDGTGALVALVDDDRDIRTTLGRGLGRLGYRCHPFGGGQDFLDALDYLKPDCILLDLRMPGMDGIETLKAMPDEMRHVAVILFTSHGDIPIAVEAVKAGAEDFIEKPASLEEIARKIDHAISQRRPKREEMQSLVMARELLGQLTPREYEVMEMACNGLTSGEIAEKIDVSVRTVEAHRHNAITKLKEDKLVNILKLFQVAKGG